MKNLIAVLLLVSSQTFAETGFDAIYGNDDREFIRADTPLKFRDHGTGVALISPKDRVVINGSEAKIYADSISYSQDLCSSERFAQNKSGGHCTGFLVAPDILVTAGHCVQSQSECKSLAFSFGATVAREADYGFNINANNVYYCSSLLETVDDKSYSNRKDYAIIKLDRPTKARRIFKLGSSSEVTNDETPNAYALGHPVGLPLMMVKNGSVAREDDFNMYMTLDLFQGNSGGPVFNIDTNNVVGMVLSGADDFTSLSINNPCRKHAYYSEYGFNSERILKVEVLKEVLKKYIK